MGFAPRCSARRTNTAELSRRECIEVKSSPSISGATQHIMPFGYHGKAGARSIGNLSRLAIPPALSAQPLPWDYFRFARDPGTIRRIDVSKSSYLPLISPAAVG